MKKILLSLATLGAVGAMSIGATTAIFSDEEVSTGNTFTAGAIDLTIDNESYYNGELNASTTWLLPANLDDGNGPGEGGAYFFFDFHDLKPGDWGEDTISFHVNDNDSWLCADVTLTSDDDNGLTEPEEKDGDVTPGVGEGELADAVDFIWWADDGDNVLEDDEVLLPSGPLGNLAVGQTATVPLADSQINIWDGIGPLAGSSTRYVGKAWCFGELTPTPVPQDGENDQLDPTIESGFECDGSLVNNLTQTDSMTADIGFRAVQSRHNDDFICEPGENGGGIGCNEANDVMFVLDSSGSIDDAELLVVETAAKAFATALAPTTTGNHIGVVDFDSTATLREHLTDVLADINDAIDELASGGNTNLADGILTASDELANTMPPGDGHDRPDASSPDFMVIITDGVPNRPLDDPEGDATAAAAAARAAGTTIFVVGVGNGVDETYLMDEIASSPAHYFSAADFDDLEATLADLADCPLDDIVAQN